VVRAVQPRRITTFYIGRLSLRDDRALGEDGVGSKGKKSTSKQDDHLLDPSG